MKRFENLFLNYHVFCSLEPSIFLINTGDIFSAICIVALKLLPVSIFITYCAGPELMLLNRVVLNDSFHIEGSFIDSIYYLLEEIRDRVFSFGDNADPKVIRKFKNASLAQKTTLSCIHYK